MNIEFNKNTRGISFLLTSIYTNCQFSRKCFLWQFRNESVSLKNYWNIFLLWQTMLSYCRSPFIHWISHSHSIGCINRKWMIYRTISRLHSMKFINFDETSSSFNGFIFNAWLLWNHVYVKKRTSCRWWEL